MVKVTKVHSTDKTFLLTNVYAHNSTRIQRKLGDLGNRPWDNGRKALGRLLLSRGPPFLLMNLRFISG